MRYASGSRHDAGYCENEGASAPEYMTNRRLITSAVLTAVIHAASSAIRSMSASWAAAANTRVEARPPSQLSTATSETVTP